MPDRNIFFFKDLNMKTLLKKDKKYDPAQLKTSGLSIGIICSSPQSRETIPLNNRLLNSEQWMVRKIFILQVCS